MKCCHTNIKKVDKSFVIFLFVFSKRRHSYTNIMFFFFSFLVEDKIETTLDAVLSDAYCRSHMFLSKQMAKLRPELTMPMFSGKKSNNIFGNAFLTLFTYALINIKLSWLFLKTKIHAFTANNLYNSLLLVAPFFIIFTINKQFEFLE